MVWRWQEKAEPRQVVPLRRQSVVGCHQWTEDVAEDFLGMSRNCWWLEKLENADEIEEHS